MELNIDGLTEDDAKLAIGLARRISARGFARGFKSRCPICGTKDRVMHDPLALCDPTCNRQLIRLIAKAKKEVGE